MANKNQLKINFPSSNSTNGIKITTNQKGKVISLNNRASIYKRIINRTN